MFWKIVDDTETTNSTSTSNSDGTGTGTGDSAVMLKVTSAVVTSIVSLMF